jgi:hypothetical protein
MLANCTVAESLGGFRLLHIGQEMKLTHVELSKIQAAICERPYESHSRELKIMTIGSATIAYTAVLLRFISRYFHSQSLGLDDWFILAAVVSVSFPSNVSVN